METLDNIGIKLCVSHIERALVVSFVTLLYVWAV